MQRCAAVYPRSVYVRAVRQKQKEEERQKQLEEKVDAMAGTLHAARLQTGAPARSAHKAVKRLVVEEVRSDLDLAPNPDGVALVVRKWLLALVLQLLGNAEDALLCRRHWARWLARWALLNANERRGDKPRKGTK